MESLSAIEVQNNLVCMNIKSTNYKKMSITRGAFGTTEIMLNFYNILQTTTIIMCEDLIKH